MKSITLFVLFFLSASAHAQVHSQAMLAGSFNFKCGNSDVRLEVNKKTATLHVNGSSKTLAVAEDCLSTSQAKGAQWCAYNQILHLRASLDPGQSDINLNASFSRNEAEISFINDYASYHSAVQKCRIFYSN